mmetsp:Transcript_3474/g.8343  ORF Transcript_3474/g.8343 Transcript_3474/m.8343 type:complete len:342 (-) Transcript_3474:2001-3026(-)
MALVGLLLQLDVLGAQLLDGGAQGLHLGGELLAALLERVVLLDELGVRVRIGSLVLLHQVAGALLPLVAFACHRLVVRVGRGQLTARRAQLALQRRRLLLRLASVHLGAVGAFALTLGLLAQRGVALAQQIHLVHLLHELGVLVGAALTILAALLLLAQSSTRLIQEAHRLRRLLHGSRGLRLGHLEASRDQVSLATQETDHLAQLAFSLLAAQKRSGRTTGGIGTVAGVQLCERLAGSRLASRLTQCRLQALHLFVKQLRLCVGCLATFLSIGNSLLQMFDFLCLNAGLLLKKSRAVGELHTCLGQLLSSEIALSDDLCETLHVFGVQHHLTLVLRACLL